MGHESGIFLFLLFSLSVVSGKALRSSGNEGEPDDFQIGMRLEAVDRKNPTLICVATIADINNDQILIHFDGWTDFFDYWASNNASDLHPIGFCDQSGCSLQEPLGYAKKFSWEMYLNETSAIPVPFKLFTENQRGNMKPYYVDGKFQAQTMANYTPTDSADLPLNQPSPYQLSSETETKLRNIRKSLNTTTSPNHWIPGLSLEARDKKTPNMICVASVVEVSEDGRQVTIHFDGWTDFFDYTTSTTDPDLHPIGYSDKYSIQLQIPPGYVGQFKWDSYITEIRSIGVDDNLFSTEQTVGPPDSSTYIMKPAVLKPGSEELLRELRKSKIAVSGSQWVAGTSLEARDKLNPTMICVASIVAVSGNSVTVHFDDWSDVYDYTTSTTDADLHPIGYCDKNNIGLQPPMNFHTTHDGEVFVWGPYLNEIHSEAVPDSLFTQTQNASPKPSDEYIMKRGVQNGSDPISPEPKDLKMESLRDDVGPTPTSGQPNMVASCKTNEILPGMKFEAVWPQMPEWIWPATVKEVRDGQIYLHWDSWESSWDENHTIDHEHFHPIGYHKYTNLQFAVPSDWTTKHPEKEFDWCEYLTESEAYPWPYTMFNERQNKIAGSDMTDINGYCCTKKSLSVPVRKPKSVEKLACAKDKIVAGMRLEAFWPQMPEYIWPATVASINDGQVHLHWDGWEENWDETHPVDHWDFHPIGYHEHHTNLNFYPPPDWTERNPTTKFSWCEYLAEVGGIPWPYDLFTKNQTDNGGLFNLKDVCCGAEKNLTKPSIAEFRR